MKEDKNDLAGFEGAQGGSKRAGFDISQSQNLQLSKDAGLVKLRDDLEERKEKTNIENNQIFSNGFNPDCKKKSQKTLEFFQNLRSSNSFKKSSFEG